MLDFQIFCLSIGYVKKGDRERLIYLFLFMLTIENHLWCVTELTAMWYINYQRIVKDNFTHCIGWIDEEILTDFCFLLFYFRSNQKHLSEINSNNYNFHFVKSWFPSRTPHHHENNFGRCFQSSRTNRSIELDGFFYYSIGKFVRPSPVDGTRHSVSTYNVPSPETARETVFG
jgi:hypothetical protein